VDERLAAGGFSGLTRFDAISPAEGFLLSLVIKYSSSDSQCVTSPLA
jgi:hypothetical protein